MEKKKSNTMNLRESNQFLIEVLYNDGTDIYKQNPHIFKQEILHTKQKIDIILSNFFETNFQGMDSLSPQEVNNIRENFLTYYEDYIEEDEKIKKWIPLGQLVGYLETLSASAYLPVNRMIDEDIRFLCFEQKHTPQTPLEHIRRQLLSFLKEKNQGREWNEIREKIYQFFQKLNLLLPENYFEDWKQSFEEANTLLQENYTDHIKYMNINEMIRDLRYRGEKKSDILRDIFGKEKRVWKPEQLEHDIHAQSAEKNRSIVEIISNAIDANETEKKQVDVEIHETGYLVRDYGSGMNPSILLEKLIIPRISGKTEKKTIGRFGIGFYTVLSHLKTKNDFVKVTTHDGENGYSIECRIHERTGDIFIHTEENKSIQQGTYVQVESQGFNASDAKELCKRTFRYSEENSIIINKEQVNVAEQFESIREATTQLKWIPKGEKSSKISLLINEVPIEHFTITGENSFKEVAIDFPQNCSLPESRSELAIDSVAIHSIYETLEMMMTQNIPDSTKITLCNTLCPVLEKLQNRIYNRKKENNFLLYLKHLLEEHVGTKSSIFLPNEECFQAIDIQEASFLDTRLFEYTPEKMEKMRECPRFVSKEGYTLFLVPFKKDTQSFVIEKGKNIFMNEEIYEKYKDQPAALNVFFSKLDGEDDTKKSKGRIEGKDTEKSKKHTPEEEVEKVLSEEQEDMYAILQQQIPSVTKDIFRKICTLSEREVLHLIKEKILEYMREDIEYLILDGDIEDETEEIILAAEEFLSHANNVQEINKKRELFLEEIMGIEKMRTITEIHVYNWIQYFKEVNCTCLFRFYEDAAEQYYSQAQKQHEEKYIGSKDFFKTQYVGSLFSLSHYIPLHTIEKEFLDHEKQYFFMYIRFMGTFMPKTISTDPYDEENKVLPKGVNEETIQRADKIFRSKILSHHSIEEIYVFIEEMESVEEMEVLRNNTTYKTKISSSMSSSKCHRISPAFRGYFVYILEGGEILNEQTKRNADVGNKRYSDPITLSTLVQAKKDNEDFFIHFEGIPKELIYQAKESQFGVDHSKAIRDIFHSIENQIVNEQYLWIREILQNSLDAVKIQRDQFSETPKVTVDTYLRKKQKRVSEKILWDMMQKVVETRFTPKYFSYFENEIKKYLSKKPLTPKNFQHVIDYLLDLKNEEYGIFFSKESLQYILDEFEKTAFFEPELVVEVQDPVGMDLNTVINSLLIPNESGKENRDDTIGKFGQGFFTILGNAKEVIVKTSIGNKKTEYIKISPIHGIEGNIIDFSVHIAERKEKFKGTIIQKIVDSENIPEIEAAFCKSAVISYGRGINRKNIQLDFRDTEINASQDILAEADIPNLGPIQMYNSHENMLTQNGLFIREIDEELLKSIPRKIRKYLEKDGIVIDIPLKIQLIRSRGDIAKKEEVLPVLKEYIPALSFHLHLKNIMCGKADFENIPYDYFKESKHRIVPHAIQKDAERIINGQILENYDIYLTNNNAWIQLLTLIPCIHMENRMISVFELAEKGEKEYTSLNLEILPPSIRQRIYFAREDSIQNAVNEKRAKNEYKTENTTIMHDTTLPKDKEIKEKASVYYAYDFLVRSILQFMNAGNIEPSYYLQLNSSQAHSHQGSDTIGFNFDYLENKIPLLSKIIEKKLPIHHKDVQYFLEETIQLVAHERQHTLEGTDEWTHNDVFFDNQRNSIASIIQNHSTNFDDVFSKMYEMYSPCYVSTKEMVSLCEKNKF
jgi:hypothetical protein